MMAKSGNHLCIGGPFDGRVKSLMCMDMPTIGGSLTKAPVRGGAYYLRRVLGRAFWVWGHVTQPGDLIDLLAEYYQRGT